MNINTKSFPKSSQDRNHLWVTPNRTDGKFVTSTEKRQGETGRRVKDGEKGKKKKETYVNNRRSYNVLYFRTKNT